MSNALKALMRGGASAPLYVDDVFSTYLYTGNGSTQTITNGIDLAGKGGLVWIKSRSAATINMLFDTARGTQKFLQSNETDAEGSSSDTLTAYNSNGFSVGAYAYLNTNNNTYTSWTFRKAAKFFDVVTYTGTSSAATTIAHNLGVTPGMIIVKRTDSTANWQVWHRSLSASTGKVLWLNQTNAEQNEPSEFTTAPTSTHFTPGSDGAINLSGATYIAYLFAHDTAADGIIQCGSFTTDGRGNATVNLGWEPQFAVIKPSSTTGNWLLADVMRGWNVGTASTDAYILANSSVAEGLQDHGNPTATGFYQTGFAASQTYIYLAIRRPNKPPTSGTQVYNAAARTGTGAAATTTAAGFPSDLVFTKKRSSTTLTGAYWVDRMRGKTNWLDSSATTAETSTADTVTGLDVMTGFVLGADATTSAFNTNTHTYVDEYFRRAPGVFDVVCYTGTGSSVSQPHSLGAIPELLIFKTRSTTDDWEVLCRKSDGNYVYGATLPESGFGLNRTNGSSFTSNAAGLGITAASFSTLGLYNTAGATYVAYLFASLPGISKVGSYTGNGGTQTINCGFSAGARFVLIKRTDNTGDWFVWDTARGIVSGNDPHLSLNTTAAEVTTDDSIDPDNSGFIVNQDAATNINVTSASYIFLAIA